MSELNGAQERPELQAELIALDSMAAKFHELYALDENGRARHVNVIKKEIVKYLNDLRGKVHPEIAKTIIGDILTAKASLPMMEARLKKHMDGYTPLAELWREEFQGAVIHNDIVYPVELWVESAEDKAWGIANEDIIALTAIEGVMSKLGINHFDGMVMMFKAKGFSGKCIPYETERAKPTDKSVHVGDSPFFFDPEEHKFNE